MNKNSCIYFIVNLINGNIYVGSTVNFNHRKNTHSWKLNNNKHNNKHLQSSFNKYGKKFFIFTPVEYCSIDQLRDKEKWWVLDLSKKEIKLYNGTFDTNNFTYISEEHKNKISLGNKGKTLGRKQSIEHIKSSADARKGTKRGFYKKSGIKRSDEFKKHLSDMRKGVPRTLETIEKIRIAAKKQYLEGRSGIYPGAFKGHKQK